MKRATLARIPLGRDEVVIALDDRDRIDIRLWTDTSGIRLPSKHGVTLPRYVLRDLIDALEQARRKEVVRSTRRKAAKPSPDRPHRIIASPPTGPNLGNMTEGITPKGIGKSATAHHRRSAGAGNVGYYDPQDAASADGRHGGNVCVS